MNARRVRAPEWLAAAAGIALLVSLFVPWYGPSGGPPRGGGTGYAPLGTLTGWQALAVIDVVLAILALAGPALLAAQVTRASPALPNTAAVGAVCCGVPAAILVIVRLVFEPAGMGPRWGVWVALASALALLAGGWWSLGEESNPAAPAPEVELRRAPPATG